MVQKEEFEIKEKVLKIVLKLFMEIDFESLYLIYISEDKSFKMSSLGDELNMAKSGVTVLVDRMALAGLVKRRTDPEDRRIMR